MAARAAASARSRSPRSAPAGRRTSGARAGPAANPANLASRTTPTIRKVLTFSGRSRPKCWSSGSSSLLKNRLTNASFTIATGAVVSLSASVNTRPRTHRHRQGSAGSGRSPGPTTRRTPRSMLRRRMPGDENHFAPVVGERVVQRQARSPRCRGARSAALRSGDTAPPAAAACRWPAACSCATRTRPGTW